MNKNLLKLGYIYKNSMEIDFKQFMDGFADTSPNSIVYSKQCMQRA